MFRVKYILLTALILSMLLLGILLLCSNNPWPEGDATQNIYYTYYPEEFKTLDPALSSFVHESNIINQICESPFTYHYLKRPYEIEPRLLESIPRPVYYDHQGKELTEDDPAPEKVAKAEYSFTVKKGIMYQPHPCFVKNKDGTFKYHNLNEGDLPVHIQTPNQFPEKGTRELKAEDFAIQMRRICDPAISSPVFSTFSSFIKGMPACSDSIGALAEKLNAKAEKQHRNTKLHPMPVPYMKVPLEGIEVIDDYHFKITLNRKYPQLIYWMAMTFCIPVPQEAIDFYSQPIIAERRMQIKNYPVGTGAFMMDYYEPTRTIEMIRNPNHKHTFYPTEGAPGDKEAGLLKDAGKPLPFLDRVVMISERETVPSWVKFMQGYYDNTSIPEEAFDKAITVDIGGDINLSDEMGSHGVSLHSEIGPKIFYFAFNMLDSTVGMYTEQQAKLRQAISVVLDYNEYIEIFLNGRGIAAQSILPPGTFGYKYGDAGTNPYTDIWDPLQRKHRRKDLAYARKLMAEAGYPSGFGPDGRRLVIYYDHADGGRPSFKAQFTWMNQRFEMLGIDLQERPTDLNRFRDKVNTGNWMTSLTGWVGDYPDPENFYMLFYGPFSKATTQGYNHGNYSSQVYDNCFRKFESMKDGPERLKLIEQADSILRHDAPACFGFCPPTFVLVQKWFSNYKPMPLVSGNYCYYKINAELRAKSRVEWNKPLIVPVLIAWGIFLIVILPVLIVIAKKRQAEEEALTGGPRSC